MLARWDDAEALEQLERDLGGEDHYTASVFLRQHLERADSVVVERLVPVLTRTASSTEPLPPGVFAALNAHAWRGADVERPGAACLLLAHWKVPHADERLLRRLRDGSIDWRLHPLCEEFLPGRFERDLIEMARSETGGSAEVVRDFLRRWRR